MKMNKKMMILLFIIAVINVSCSPTKSKIASGKEITFYVASDTHYLAESLMDNGDALKQFVETGDGRELNYIHEIMSAFSNDIKKKKPDVLIISGDLTNNGEKQSHLELAKRLKEIEKTGTSVYVIPGNHDIMNPYARGFKGSNQYKVETIDQKDFSTIYDNFGYSEAISKDETTLSYLAAPSEDVWLLMLDTAEYENNENLGYPQIDGRIAPKTMIWIKECSNLAKSKGAEIIAVMHHSLLSNNGGVNKGFTIDNSNEATQLFKECGIQLALSGHIHLQEIKADNNNDQPLYNISTACIGIYPQKYGILKYSPKNGLDYTTASVDVDSWSKEAGVVDEYLNNFKERSREFYGGKLFAKIISRLAITDFYSSEELKMMGNTYEELYLRYYEGEKEVATEEIRNSVGFKLWLSDEAGSFNRSLLRILGVNGENNNNLHIPSVD